MGGEDATGGCIHSLSLSLSLSRGARKFGQMESLGQCMRHPSSTTDKLMERPLFFTPHIFFYPHFVSFFDNSKGVLYLAFISNRHHHHPGQKNLRVALTCVTNHSCHTWE